MKSYSDLYTLRRTPSFVPYFVLSSAIFHLSEIRNDETSSVSKGRLAHNMADLKNLSGCHGFATRALDIVQTLGYKWDIGSMFGVMHDERDSHNISEDSLISMNQLAPIISDMAMMDAKEASSTAGSVFKKAKKSVGVGTQLEDNGFRRLRERQ